MAVVPINPQRRPRVRVPARQRPLITDEMVAWAGRRPARRSTVFALQEPMPGVVPEGQPTLAQDSAVSSSLNWAQGSFAFLFEEGLTFLGYPYLAELAQRPEYRRISETIASEMTREWIDLKSTSDEDKSDKIDQLKDAMKRLQMQEAFRRIAEQDGFFGRSHLYLDFGGTTDPDELKTPIGGGRDTVSKAKIGRNSLEALRPVEAVWAYPTDYNSTDPLASNWYRPLTWYVMGKQIHATRFLTFVGREVPDLLKPAYSFGGLSLSQMVKPYVDNWLRTRASVGDLVHSFSVSGMKTNLAVTLNKQGEQGLYNRADFYNKMRDNRGMLLIDKDTEEFFNVSTPLGGLDALQAQSQEHICLARNSFIETQRGQVPIDCLELTDQVMTRDGLAPIDWVGCTGYTTELYLIGDRLWVTPDHQIYLPEINAFVRAKHVKVSDRLLESPTWQATSMGRQFSGAATGGDSPRPGITATSRLAACCTAFYGKLTSARSQKAGTSTIPTRTRQTIASTIWNVFRTGITSATTSIRGGWGLTFTQEPSLEFASTAASPMRDTTQRAPIAAPNIAAKLAIPLRVERQTPSEHADRGASQIKDGGRAGMIPSSRQNINAVIVKNLKTPEPVYNLRVVNGYLPEFFANGILTHNCSASGLPLIKFTGLTPTGLNASSEGEIRAFYDWVAAYQEQLFRKHMTRVLDFIQLSEFGAIDPDITFEFRSLWQLDEAGKATVQQTKAQIHTTYEEMGAVSNEEVRQALIADPDSLYAGLDLAPEDLPQPPAPEGMSGAQPEPQLAHEPGSSPGHAKGTSSSVRSPFGGGSRDPLAGERPTRSSLGSGV